MKKFIAFLTSVAVIVALLICAVGCEEDKSEQKEVPDFTYAYGEDEIITPFWLNEQDGYTVIYNEIVTPIQYGSKAESATGYLAYDPYEIISVRDYTLKKEYGEGDYTVEGNAITVPTDGSMPYVCNEWLDCKNVPEDMLDYAILDGGKYTDWGGTNFGKHIISEGSLTRTNYLCVTYAYKSSEQELGFDTPRYTPDNFARILSKLQSGEPIKMLVFGDSIFTGASASSVVGFEPALPAFFDLVRSALADVYYGGDESKISVVNQSVGGTTSDWGVEQVENGAFDMSGYDLVLIGFGMNDGFAGFNTSPSHFTENIRKIVSGIRAYSKGADFLVVGSFTPNPKSIFAGNHEDFIEPVSVMCSEENGDTSGCTYLDMFEMSMAFLKNKQKNNPKDGRYQYVDLSANYTNHPNDFTVRLYAGAILSTFCQKYSR